MQKLAWRVKLVADSGAGAATEIEVARIERHVPFVSETLGQPPKPLGFAGVDGPKGRRSEHLRVVYLDRDFDDLIYSGIPVLPSAGRGALISARGSANCCLMLKRCDMSLQLGDTAPDFEALTTQGLIKFHEWIGDSWCVLFSHPKDFTPVCTTELGYMAKLQPEFARRNVKIIGLSVDPVENHAKWAVDIEETQGAAPNYPMIGDTDLRISKLYGMLPASASGDASARTPADNQTVRNVFVIGPDKKIKLLIVYPMTTGRNFDEVLRVIDSLQLTAKHKVATPVNWKPGEDVIIAGSVSDEDAKKTYPQGWKAPRPYIRIVPQPR